MARVFESEQCIFHLLVRSVTAATSNSLGGGLAHRWRNIAQESQEPASVSNPNIGCKLATGRSEDAALPAFQEEVGGHWANLLSTPVGVS